MTTGQWFTCTQCGKGYQAGPHFCNTSQTSGTLWNGPICHVCGFGYLGAHECDPQVLRLKAYDLMAIATAIEQGQPVAPSEVES